jgi:hypothetical protein
LLNLHWILVSKYYEYKLSKRIFLFPGAQSDSELTTVSSSDTGDRGYNSDGELYSHDPAAIAGKHVTAEAKGQVVEAKPLPARDGSWMLVRQCI